VRLSGSRCADAAIHHPLNAGAPFTLELFVHTRPQSPNGCLSWRALIALTSDAGVKAGGSFGGRTLLLFADDLTMKIGGGEVLGPYAPQTWYKVKIAFERISSAGVRISYWINDVLKTSQVSGTGSAASLEYVTLNSGEGLAWFDDVKVTPGMPPLALPAIKAVVNGASFSAGPVSPDSWADSFGTSLATRFLLDGKLPESLDGTTLTITDSRGTVRRSRLHLVSQDRIQFLVPGGLSPGRASLMVTNSSAASNTIAIEIATVAPGVFSANASGRGPAAASFLRVRADGSRSDGFTFTLDAPPNRLNVPIDLGPAGDVIYISFFGTGFRFHRTATVQIGGLAVTVVGAVAQGQFEGLDQLVVGPLPRELAGRRDMDVLFTADGRAANVVTLSIF
jgi:uncharacterized protein (TIGR03437 family)